jgi:hypothetical protein
MNNPFWLAVKLVAALIGAVVAMVMFAFGLGLPTALIAGFVTAGASFVVIKKAVFWLIKDCR